MFKKIAISLVFICSSVNAASFNCSKAYSKVEKLICNTPSLSKADDELYIDYKKAREVMGNSDEFKEIYARNRNLREKYCDTEQCLLDWYKSSTVLYRYIAGDKDIYNDMLELMPLFIPALIEQKQKKAVSDSLRKLTDLKISTAEYYSQFKECSGVLIGFSDGWTEYPNTIENISISNSLNGCRLKADFVDSALLPDLSKESMTLTMTMGEDRFYWSCKFTGKNKRYIPKSCK